MNKIKILFLINFFLYIFDYTKYVNAKIEQLNILTNYTFDIVQAKHVVLFGCEPTELLEISKALHKKNQFVNIFNTNGNYCLQKILKPTIYAKTAVIVDTDCAKSVVLIYNASIAGYFNKTYQWLLWDNSNKGVEYLLPMDLPYLGPNAQLTYVNHSAMSYQIWDVHSKGRHLKAPLDLILIAEKFLSPNNSFVLYHKLKSLQSIYYRNNFKGLALRGASVIDQENITSNEQVNEILSRTTKDSGISAFSKYHYELLNIVREYFNFTVNFRNARGWAGRLGNSKYRLGYLGIIMRNEADIGASGAFNRINRFAEFDIVHQSWKFETAFLYRFTPDLDMHGKSGNFLAPFDDQVWLIACTTLLVMNIVWRFVAYIRHLNHLQQKSDARETTLSGVSLKTFAAVCQQGLDPIPSGLATRTIILTTFMFSVVMYNYYTSSVVGGLLSSTARGPTTVDEVVNSPLKVSFEDIGYYKVLFRENKSPTVINLLNRKVLPARYAHDLPVYAHINEAIPYLKNGTFAFHCEVVDAYPEIAKYFDVTEICDLRVVSGLLETEIMNWIITKNSMYTELFRNVMDRAREVGLVSRLLRQRQPKKPKCQALYTVYPVSLSGVLSAFYLLIGSILCSLFLLFMEMLIKRYEKGNFKFLKSHMKD